MMKAEKTQYAMVALLAWLDKFGHEVVDTPETLNASVIAKKDDTVTFYAVVEGDVFREAEYTRDEFEADLLAFNGAAILDSHVTRCAVTVVRCDGGAKLSFATPK